MRKFILLILVVALISIYVSAQGVVPIGLIATPQKVVIAGGSTTIKGIFPSHYRVYNKIIVVPTNSCLSKRYINITGTQSSTPGWVQGNFEMNLNLGECFYAINETVNATNLTNRCIVAGPCTYQNKDLTAFSYACYVNENKTWTCGWYSVRLNYSVIKPADVSPPSISNINPHTVLFVKKSFDPSSTSASLDLYNLKDASHIESLNNKFEYTATATDCSNITTANIYLNNEGNILTGAAVSSWTGNVVAQNGECLCDPSELKTVYINKTIFCSNPIFTGIGYSTAVEKITGAAITGGPNLTGGVCEPGGPIPNPQQYGSFTPEPMCTSGTSTLYTGCNTITAVATDSEGNFEERSQPFYVVPQGNSEKWARYTLGESEETLATLQSCLDSRPSEYIFDNTTFTARSFSNYCESTNKAQCISCGSSSIPTQNCQLRSLKRGQCYHSAVWVDSPRNIYFGVTYIYGGYRFYVNGAEKSYGVISTSWQTKSIEADLQKGWNYFDIVLNARYDDRDEQFKFVSSFNSSVGIRNPAVRPDSLLYPKRDYNPRGTMGLS